MNIQIKKDVLERILLFAKDAHPKEMVLFLEGEIKKETIIISDLVFQPYIASTNSAMPRIDLPLTSKIIGSVHSHPGSSNKPSKADAAFFHKTGIVHGIVNYPFIDQNLQFYDLHAQPLEYDKV